MLTHTQVDFENKSVIYVIVLCSPSYCKAIYISSDIKNLVNRATTLPRARNLSYCVVPPRSQFEISKVHFLEFQNLRGCRLELLSLKV